MSKKKTSKDSIKHPIQLGHYPFYFDYVPESKLEEYGNKYSLDVRGALSPTSKAVTLVWTETQPYKGQPLCLVVFADKTVKDGVTISTYMAHEAYHVVCRVFEYIGEKNPGEECFAYALDHVVNNLLLRYYEYHDE